MVVFLIYCSKATSKKKFSFSIQLLNFELVGREIIFLRTVIRKWCVISKTLPVNVTRKVPEVLFK